MKKRLFFAFSFCVFASISVAFGSYIIKNFTINGVDGNVEINTNPDKENYKKVTFNNLASTYGMAQTRAAPESNYIYVKKGDYLTFDDLPVDITDSLIEWKKANGETVLSVLENGYSGGFQVNEDLDLYPSKIDVSTATSPTSNEIKKDESNEDNDGNINISGNTVRIEEGTNDRNTTTEVVIDKPIFNGATVESTFKDQDGNEATEQNLEKTGEGDTTSYQHTMDQTIGLEDPAAEASDYKPNAGITNSTIGQSNVNNCVSRIKLSSDLYLSNTTLTIGARVGFCRWGPDSSQTNYQGFIVGSYNELDLCGKTLIVGSGSQLKIIGSLVDSVGGGQIVVENGGTLITTFVVEDAYHETSIPSAYSLGDAPFKMYRAPYLNASIKFNKGSKFLGNIKIDFGSDGNTNMYNNKYLNIIGDSNDYMINTSGSVDNSYILRETTWDEELILNTKNESGTRQDIVYEKINFKFYECNNVVINNPLLDEFTISGVSISLVRDRADFYIPNYYSFYLYNSSVVIKNNLVFLPGSYLFADENSSITLSAESYGTLDLGGLSTSLLPSEVRVHDFYQSVGGLIFVHEKANYSEMTKYKSANDSVNLRVFLNTTNFWSYLNKYRPSYADVYGEIKFDTSKTLYKELYHLGGEINIYDLNSFAQNVNNASSFIELYNSAFYVGPCHFELTLGGDVFFNVTDYFGYPLVTQGNVLTSMTSGLGVIGLRSDYNTTKYTYDFDSGVVNGNGTYYIPIFMDKNGTYNNWCNHINKTKYEPKNPWIGDDYTVDNWKVDNDDSRIVFNACTYDASSRIAAYNSENFIYFRGGFFKYNGSQVDIYKFRNYNSNTGDNTNSYMNVKLVKNDSYYGHDAWRLS